MVRKTIFLTISGLVSAIVTFMSIKKVLYEFPQKYFKTTEGHSLAVCGSLCGEKYFLLIYIPFNGLIKNISLYKSKFSSGFSRFKNG